MQDVMQTFSNDRIPAIIDRKMELAKLELKRHPRKTWWQKDRRNTQHILPKLDRTPTVDYSKLKWLCNIEGLQSRTNDGTTDEAHTEFMENFRSMFVQPPKKLGFPVHSEKRGKHKTSDLSLNTSKATMKTTVSDADKKVVKKSDSTDETSHDVRDYLRLLHKERKSEDPQTVRAEKIKTLRRLLRKLPFDRSAAENDKIFKITKMFPQLADEVPDNVLKELCVVAVLETWKENDFTVFGNSGFHLILRGSVWPQTYPYVSTKDSPGDFREDTPILADTGHRLTVGDCFGTFKKIARKEPNSKVLSVVTTEANCEFFKVTISDYARVIEQIRQREQTEKVNLLVSCGNYKFWPRQPLLKVADLIEWINYPANTVLVSEGYKAPYITFIKSGECHVLRQVEVLNTLKNGTKEKKTKQVVMGKLSKSDSFAEISILLEEPITCSVVTASAVELGTIKPDRIKELDEVTTQLFIQSNDRTFGKLTKDDIQEEYMQQELKREWNQFKHGVVVDVINSRGIRPGYGKWSK